MLKACILLFLITYQVTSNLHEHVCGFLLLPVSFFLFNPFSRLPSVYRMLLLLYVEYQVLRSYETTH
jgi:hypothetical protein